MKNVNIMVVERDGTETRSFVLRLGVNETILTTDEQSIRQAVVKACTDFVKTDKGKELYDYNCGSFNWADFESEVPNALCEKYGFVKRDTAECSFDVDWDEYLVDDTELGEEEE